MSERVSELFDESIHLSITQVAHDDYEISTHHFDQLIHRV